MLPFLAFLVSFGAFICLVSPFELLAQSTDGFVNDLVKEIQSDQTLTPAEQDNWTSLVRDSLAKVPIKREESRKFADIAYGILSDAKFNGITCNVAVKTAREALIALSQNAPVDEVEELCSLSFVLPLKASQFGAYAVALKRSHDESFPLEVIQEVIRVSAEDNWELAVFGTIFDGLMRGFTHNLSPDKLAVFMMISIKQKLGAPEQIVLDAMESVRKQEPDRYKTVPELIKAPVPSLIFPQLQKIRLDLGQFRESIESFVGTPYVWGGSSRQGVDCSGFTKTVLNEIGISLPRVSRDQARCGEGVQRTSLKLGDLVFFDTKGRGEVTHVGIYLGGDVVVHSGCSQGVTYVLLQDRYFLKRFLFSKRIVDID